MRRELIIAAALAATLLGGSPAFAQVGGVGSPSPGMGLTSPFGMSAAAGGSVGPAGVPLGATELATPGLSPAPPGTLGSGFTTCSAWSAPPPIVRLDRSTVADLELPRAHRRRQWAKPTPPRRAHVIKHPEQAAPALCSRPRHRPALRRRSVSARFRWVRPSSVMPASAQPLVR